MRKLVVIAAVAALSLTACSTADTSPPEPMAPAQSDQVEIGTAVNDGMLKFTVSAVYRTKTMQPPGGEPALTAQGEFVNVHMTVDNTGNQPQRYVAAEQRLIADGKEYSPVPALVADGGGQTINPEAQLRTVVSFDVPPEATPESIVVHGNPGGRGSKIAFLLAETVRPSPPGG